MPTVDFDFDAFRREQEQEPLKLRIGGREYDLPPSPPAIVALEGLRLSKAGVKKVPPEKVEAIARGLFPGDLLDEIVTTHGLSVAELAALIERVMDAYGKSLTPPPNRETRRATTTRSR